MEYNSERLFLKELFAHFCCKEEGIKEIDIGDDELPLMSFAIGDAVEGCSIDCADWKPFFGVDTPHFCIVSQGIGYVRIDLCMDLSLVKYI